jgi:murein L,D-transpeptidase YcbB/YkuD
MSEFTISSVARGCAPRPFRQAAAGVLVLAAAAGFGAPRVSASDGANDWMRFGGSGIETGSTTRQSAADRSFVKEWEANPPRGFPTLSPANIEPTKAAIKRYTAIVDHGGFKAVPDVQMQVGSNGPAVGILRERFLMSGDLKEPGSFSEHFDYYLEKAVKRFQASNGLTPTGIVEKRTVAALNVPASARLKQLKTNLARLLELARGTGKKYLIVNIPAAQIEAVEGDRVVSRHTGVVGKIDRPTPILRSAVHQMNFNPVWTLPPTVIEKDLIPKGQEMQRRGQNVLVKYGIDAYDGNGKKLDPASINWSTATPLNLSYRQQPGRENPLGFLKINFHNSYSVYMHDTPSETLFGRNFRAASSGCVRVAGIEHLASWLLTDNGGWSPERIAGMRESGEKLDVSLKKPVPLYFVYITAWVTEDGVVNFRRDLYNKDGVGAIAGAY